MNILFIISKLYGGGAERVTARLASALCREHNVYVYCMYPKPGGSYPVDPRVHVEDYVRAKLYRKGWRREFLLDAVRQVRQKKREWDIDCAISMLRPCNFVNVMSRGREKVIVSIRCTCTFERFATKREERIADFMIRRAARKADLVVGVSRRVSMEHIADYGARPSKTLTIYNPLDMEELGRAAGEPLEDAGLERFLAAHSFVFITAGRLTEQKGQWHLIRTLRRVREDHPDAGLVILGTGPLEDYLRRVAEANGLDGHVYLAGFTDRPFAYYRRADAFVFPTTAEGFPNALLEAMGCGLPVISCDCNSGPRELLAPETDILRETETAEYARYGVLTPTVSRDMTLTDEDPDPQEQVLAEAMLRMISDGHMRESYRLRSLERAAQFPIGEIAEEWLRAIRKAGCTAT